jgi:Protein of unknown function (DUF1173)
LVDRSFASIVAARSKKFGLFRRKFLRKFMQHNRHFALGNRRFEPTQDDIQAILKTAYQDKQRPLCLCRSTHPAMYVAYIAESYVLKRMPGTGRLHDAACESFDPPPELSGLGELGRNTIVTDETGETVLKLDFPLTKRPGRAPPAAAANDDAASVKTEASKLGLLGLLHYLWDSAELTKWRSNWAGKRNWFVVRREILAVVERTTTKATPLASVLYVPAIFSPEKKEELTAHRRRFMHSLQAASGKPQSLGITVAEFKGQEPSKYGRRLILKHLPDFSIFLSEDLGKKFDVKMGGKIKLVEASQDSHLIIIATFSVNGSYAEIVEIAAMPVTGQWVPFEHDREFELISKLSQRRFIKCLKYNMGNTGPIANALLTDTEPPTALYCPKPDITEADAEDLSRLAHEGKYPAWVWPANHFDMPPLPK